mmetsp:Transcript_40092/g.85938  ORF Transcript_40092/g.85938 Transcript_40092/m.85938 type:complete len:382 (-) Transcript_40092:708-1853(-)
MPVSSHQQVQAVLLTQLAIEGATLPILRTGEVRHRDLPRGCRLFHRARQPGLLLLPKSPEPRRARILVNRTTSRCAGCPCRVVGSTDVVIRIFVIGMGILEVGVEEPEIDGEHLCGVLHSGAPIGCRHDPSRAGPGVGDLLIPAVVEDTAAPVVISQHGKPRLAVQALAAVNTFEDLIELMVCGEGDRVHGGSAVLLDASPVEVVADIEDVLGVADASSVLHGLGHQELRLVVDALDVAAAIGALRASLVLEALDKWVVLAVHGRITRVHAASGEDRRSLFGALRIGDQGRSSLDGVQSSIHAAPVTDGEDVHCLATFEGVGWPLLAVVVEGLSRRLAFHGGRRVGAAGAFDPIGVATIAVAAGWKGAVARRGATGLASWR